MKTRVSARPAKSSRLYAFPSGAVRRKSGARSPGFGPSDMSLVRVSASAVGVSGAYERAERLSQLVQGDDRSSDLTREG